MTHALRLRRSLAVLATVGVWLASGTSSALAMPPGLPLPEWIEVTIVLDGIPEVQKEFTVRGKVRVNIGRMRGGKYRFRLPPGVDVVSGQRDGEISLSAGEAKDLVLAAKLLKPSPDSTVGLEVVTSYPRDALLEDVLKRYEGKPGDQIDALHRKIDGLTGSRTFAAMAPFSATAEEGFGSEEEPAFLHYFRPSGGDGPALALLAPRSAPPAAGARSASVRELFARNPKLAELFSKGGQSPALLSARGDADDYSGAVRDLEAGHAKEALETFRTQAVRDGLDPVLRFAAANAHAVALQTLGRSAEAEADWKKLCGDLRAGSLIRYTHYNLAEIYRAAGQGAEAKMEYRKALEVRPAFTAARRRLEETR